MSEMRSRRSPVRGQSDGTAAHPSVGTWPDPWEDGRRRSLEELSRLRNAVASGTYAAPIDAVVESIVDSMVSRSPEPPARPR